MTRKGETSRELALSIRASGRGFALLEALVAGALLGWILLVGLDFLVIERRAEERLVAHRQAMRALETAMEGIRVGLIDPVEGPIDLEGLVSSFEVQLRMEVEEEAAMSDLLRVRIEAIYQVRGEVLSRDLETLVWHP